jgi:hypothetical protein
MLGVKFFEVIGNRKVPVAAIKIVSSEATSIQESAADIKLIKLAGYDAGNNAVVLLRLDTLEAHDQHDAWGQLMMQKAHEWTEENFDDLLPGSTLDVNRLRLV